ncbi:hypothetical protein DEJ13_11450 [Curtobacterium sp. MCLR17_007]|uniref:hypothetical protein n=1 Tax=unclassified Curtobacterium TaxID=257496 RepID=UPI0007022229|nr:MULTISPECIES: hypothetical protein [unclassified Curtobacterium]KQS06489.1 hypothetical protein ASG04_15470 [Curtobacterium sp. Leaf183]WIB59070.1 hypothetical protein DEJ13_11450 [Curtobacterium sp. MCLR17_007]
MDRAPRTLPTAVAALVVLVVATAGAWYRLGPVTRATVWAEDGGPFFRDRLADGPVDSLLRPYAGYLHLLPRLVVDLGFARPIEEYAVTVAGACCVVVGVVSAAVFVLARDLVPAWPLRVVLAAVPVVVPVVPFEISGNAANLHWFMLVLVPWLFAARVRTWWGSALVAVLALGAVLTEPQTLLFAPLLVVAWWRPGLRDRLRALPVTVATVLAGAAQVTTALTTERASRPGDPSIRDVVHGYLLQPLAGAWTRRVGSVAAAVEHHGAVVVVLPAVLVAVLLVVAVVVGPWRARVQVLALGIGSVVVWTAALVLNASANGQWGEQAVTAFTAAPPTRYAAASAVLLTEGVVLAASVLIDRRSRSVDAGSTWLAIGGASVGWLAIAVVVAAAVTNVAPGDTQRSGGPAWRPQVASQTDACRADPSGVVHAKTAPWGTTLPCTLVLGGR